MNVRFKMTSKGEVAILPRKDYEILAAKAREADEDFGTARLVARARKEIAAGMCHSFRDRWLIKSPAERTRCASGAVKRSFTSRARLILDRVTLRRWRRSLPSDGRAGEVLGCLGDCAAAGYRGVDPAAAGAS